jgi:hypothetical protein
MQNPVMCYACEKEPAIGRMPLKWTRIMRLKYIGREGFQQFEPYETNRMINICIKCAHTIPQIRSFGWDFWSAYDSDLVDYYRKRDLNDWIRIDESFKPEKQIKVSTSKRVTELVDFFTNPSQ